MLSNNKISDQKRTKFRNLLRKRIGERRKKLINEKINAIKNKISENYSEIKDAGIIIVAFNNNDCPFKYIRTEPLFYSKEKNFDVLLYGNKTILLISIKETVMDNNAFSHIKSLKLYQEDVENNIEITDKAEGIRLKIVEFYKRLVGEIENKEFILATQKPLFAIINKTAKELEYSFCLWKLVEKQNKIFIINDIINRGTESGYFGHKDKVLNDYLKSLAKYGKNYNEALTFMQSSSRYLRATKMAIPLSKFKNGFDFNNWIDIFDVDLMNWHKIEKETLYENYISYCLDCGIIKCLDNKDNILLNKYKIASIYSIAPKLELDIIQKMARFEIDKGILKEEILQIKKQVTSEVLSEQANERGENLSKYIPKPLGKDNSNKST